MYVCVATPLLLVLMLNILPATFNVIFWFTTALLSASVSVAVIVMAVLFIGVVLDTFTVSLVLIFLTVMLVVALLFTYWLFPVYVTVIVCFPSVVGV